MTVSEMIQGVPLLMLLEALTFGAAALVHRGRLVSSGQHQKAEIWGAPTAAQARR